MAIRTLEEKGLSILFLSTGDGSSFLGGKERSRSKKRTDIGGLKEEKGLSILFLSTGDGSSFLGGKERKQDKKRRHISVNTRKFL